MTDQIRDLIALCGIERAGRVSARAPLVAPFTVLSAVGTWVFVECLGQVGISAQLGCAGLAAFGWCALGHGVARLRRFRWLLLWIAPPFVGAALGAFGVVFHCAISGGLPLWVWWLHLGFVAILAGVFGGTLLIPPMLLIHLAERGVGRARAGSVLDRSDRSRVWLVCFALLLLVCGFSGFEDPALSPLRIVVVALTGAAVTAFAAIDLSTFRRLKAARTTAERAGKDAAHAESRTEVPRVDLGIGEERWLCYVKRGPAYRGDDRAAFVLIGAADRVLSLLKWRGRFSSGLALLSAALLVFVALQGLPELDFSPKKALAAFWSPRP